MPVRFALLFVALFALTACQPKEEKSHVTECGMTERQLSEAQLAGRMLVDFHPIGGDRVCAVFATEADMNKKSEKKTYKAYRDFDDSTRGIRAQLYDLEKKNPEVMKVEVLGLSHQKREVLGVRLTSSTAAKGKKGQVLYVGLHHAREWVTVDLMMRWLNHLLAGAAKDPEIQLLLQRTEIWLVPVLNPDGYQYTFDTNRMWRKNLRDNNGDGKLDDDDGVDLNRNYDFQWGYDEYGASDKPRSGTFRGPSAFSEPETAALRDLIQRQKFTHAISFHSFGNLILYPSGYRPFLEPADQPVFEYLAGTPEKSAVYDSANKKFYRPGSGASLYTTNGDFDDWAYHAANLFSFTVELTNLKSGFDFPDDEALLEQLFQDNLPFMKDLLMSARDVKTPVSHIRQAPLARITHKAPVKTYGGVQQLEVLARKGTVVQLERVKDVGAPASVQRFEITDTGVLFDRHRAQLRRLSRGDEVKYRVSTREGNARYSYPEDGYYVFKVEGEGGKKILLLGSSPGAAPGANEALTAYAGALDGLGFANAYDTYQKLDETVTNQEVLAHYPSVIWHLGNGERDLSSAQIVELAKYIRGGGAFYLAGAPKRTSFYDDGDASTFNFFAYDLGVESLIPSAFAVSSKAKSIEVPAGDPVFGGLSFALARPADGAEVRFPLLEQSAEPEARGGMVQSLPVLASLGRGKAGYSYLEFPLEIPAEGPAEMRMVYLRGVWEMYFFVEVLDTTTGQWVTLNSSTVRDMNSELGGSCSLLMQQAPHLSAYLGEKCEFKAGADGKLLFKNLFFRDSWDDVVFDLTVFRGKKIALRVSAIAPAEFDGNMMIPAVKLKLGEAVTALEPASFGGAWKIGQALSAPLMMSRSNTVFFPVGLEHVQGEKSRGEILSRVLNYLGVKP